MSLHVTGPIAFAEFESDLFDFNNTAPGKYLQLVIRKTSLENGWANCRIFPQTAGGDVIPVAVPEPGTWAMVVGLGLLTLAAARRGRDA